MKPDFVASLSDRLLSQLMQEVRHGHISYFLDAHSLPSVDNQFQTHTVLRMESPCIGAVSDNFDERIDQKIFHAEIVVDNAKVAKETNAYKQIPIITDFTDENGNDIMDEMVKENYINIKNEVKQIVSDELERIANDENLCHLLNKNRI